MKRKIYIETYGGLGDIVLLTPTFRELKQRWPAAKIIVLCRGEGHRQVLLNNPHIALLLKLSFYNRPWYRLLAATGLIRIVTMKYAARCPSFTYSKRAASIIAEMAGITLPEQDAQLFLLPEEQRKAKAALEGFQRPIVIHITSIATSNQMWPVDKWQQLVKSLPEHTFIQLGAAGEARVEGAIDWRGRTGIRESMALVQQAAGFVGVVSFLSHVTNAFQTRGVVFFGPSSIAVWGHPNNINLSKHLPCAGCVDWLRSTPCPYNKPCMRLISVEEVRKAVVRQVPLAKEKTTI